MNEGGRRDSFAARFTRFGTPSPSTQISFILQLHPRLRNIYRADGASLCICRSVDCFL